MKYNEILASIDNKKYQNIYFLAGDENYYIDKISDYISNKVLADEEKSFNQVILYGKETSALEIISEAKQYPFGAKYRVIIVKEAQQIRNIDKLEAYCDNPLNSTVLVICYKKKIDKRKSFFKKIIKTNQLFESNKLYENQISGWINNYFTQKKLSITNESCEVLTQHLGTDLSKITNEIEKMLININDEKTITLDLIEKHIGISKDFNIFELQNSLATKDIYKCNLIAKFLSANQKSNPFVLTISSVFSFFKKVLIFKQVQNQDRIKIASTLKINPYFVSQYQTASRNYTLAQLNQIFEYINNYELRSKGIGNNNTSSKSLLEELIFKILHC